MSLSINMTLDNANDIIVAMGYIIEEAIANGYESETLEELFSEALGDFQTNEEDE